MLFGTEQLGFSVTTTTVLFMTLWLGSGLLEIPTGALADRYGRKRTFLVGTVLLSLYPIAYIAKLPVAAIFVVSLVSAFGSALRSGALVPLVHDSYKKEGRSDQEYHNFLSNEKVLTFVARALSGVIGGIMYATSPQLPYAAIFAAYIAMIVAGLFTVEVVQEKHSTLSNRLHIKETLLALRRTPIIIALLTSYITFQLVGEALWTAYQPLFKSDGISAQGIGLIFSIIAVLSAIGAYSSRYFMKKVGVLKTELFVGLMVLLTCLMLVSPSLLIRVLAIIPSGFAFGLSMPPIVAVVQKHVASKFHSTALSVVSVVQYGIYGVGSLYIAFIIDTFGTEITRKILLTEAVAMTVLLVIIYLRNKKWDEVVTTIQPAPEM